jgi:hypothetical protein
VLLLGVLRSPPTKTELAASHKIPKVHKFNKLLLLMLQCLHIL